MNTGAELVDFIKQHDAVIRAGAAECLDDIARQGAQIGAPVSPDFRFIVYAPHTDTDKFAAGGFGNALPKGRFTDTRGADKTQERASAFRVELVYGQKFQNAPFDFFQAIVILVQLFACLGNVGLIFTGD